MHDSGPAGVHIVEIWPAARLYPDVLAQTPWLNADHMRRHTVNRKTLREPWQFNTAGVTPAIYTDDGLRGICLLNKQFRPECRIHI